MRARAQPFLLLAALALGAAAPGARALEYRSVSVDAAVLFDGPSIKARPVAILSRHYPVEVVVALDGWLKVRDATGELAWIEARQLSARRTLSVRVPRAQVRAAPEESAALVFEAQQDVVLELLEVSGNFVRVRHARGMTGYVHVTQVWGL
ncbi:MAG: SH3 domain-containing protein [Burkholderiales bacterium]|nr:SH3 domain-containing protein [Burkholderiales bacterium]